MTKIYKIFLIKNINLIKIIILQKLIYLNMISHLLKINIKKIRKLDINKDPHRRLNQILLQNFHQQILQL
jgi:hypothetical protein